MRRYGWILGLAVLTLIQVAGAEAGTLQLQVESGRVSIDAQGVTLGEILEALSQRTGIRVVIDERGASQPVSVAIEAKGIREAIGELRRRMGGGTYVILYTDALGDFEIFRFTEGESSPLGLWATLQAPDSDSPDPGGEATHGSFPGQAVPVGDLEATGAPAASPEGPDSVKPLFIRPRTAPVYLAPESAPVTVPEVVAPVYLPPAEDPQYVPDIGPLARDEAEGGSGIYGQ